MSLAVIHSRALHALAAAEVTVEVHLTNGLPSFTLVGLADVEVKEARERVRAAIQNSGLEFPTNKRITVNLAPADLPKESGRFDLPIALGILAASGQIDAARLSAFEFAGELSLSGELRPVRGALAMALALRRGSTQHARALVLPLVSAREAALVDGLPIHGAAHLLDVVAALLPVDSAQHAPLPFAKAEAVTNAAALPDLRDVKGQAAAKRALEIAAAGGHSVLMLGSPGTGKSMLAQRFAGLLPPMTQDDALESAAVLSLTGAFASTRWGQRVLRSPHHTASSVALVGGGSLAFLAQSISHAQRDGGQKGRSSAGWVVERVRREINTLFAQVFEQPPGDGGRREEHRQLLAIACIAPHGVARAEPVGSVQEIDGAQCLNETQHFGVGCKVTTVGKRRARESRAHGGAPRMQQRSGQLTLVRSKLLGYTGEALDFAGEREFFGGNHRMTESISDV